MKRQWAAVLRAMLSRPINAGGNPFPPFLPRKRATLREWTALTFAMLFPTVMAWLYFVALASPPTLETTSKPSLTRPNPLAQSAYAIGKVIQFGFPLLYLARFDRHSLRPARGKFTGLPLGVAFGLLVGASILVLYSLMLRDWLIQIGTAAMVRTKVAEFNATTPARFMLLTIFLAGAHSLLEEYYWRWFVFGRLRWLVTPILAAIISSLAFMAHHVIVLSQFFPGQLLNAVVPFSLCIGGGGMVWAWLYHRSGSIASPWLSHLLVDVAVMAVGYDLIFG